MLGLVSATRNRMRAYALLSESAQWQITSCADHSFGAGRHLSAGGGTFASAPRSRAGPSAYCWISACRFARSSTISARLELAPQHLRDPFRGEAELQERLADVEVLAIDRDLSALELEEAHAPEPDLLAGAPRHGVGHDVAERPLGGCPVAGLDHRVHDPAVVTALAEHPLEHLAERGMTPMLAVEVVGVAGAVREAADQCP